MIQNTDWQDLQKSQPIPYYDPKDGCIKGCKLMLQMNTKERIELNLLEQDLNNTYTYKSQIMLLGQKRFNIKGKQFPQEYVMVVSAILRKNIIEKKIFERSEAYSILRDA